MPFVLQPWQFFFVILVGWVHREQQKIIEFYQAVREAMMKAQDNRTVGADTPSCGAGVLPAGPTGTVAPQNSKVVLG